MDALKIAFETMLIGALAIPWLLLGIHLFFPDAKAWVKNYPLGTDSIQYGVVAVLAVALGYTVGAAVSRLAQDFFNDNDFGIPLPAADKIRASVYCFNDGSPWFFDAGVSLPGGYADGSLATLCPQHFSRDHKVRESADQSLEQVFNLQESALLLMGEDKTSQLRHLHQQLMVLRGAAFDGAIAAVLCLFAWNARKEQWGRGRLVIPVAMFLYIFFRALLWNHLDYETLWNQRDVQGWGEFLHPFRHSWPDDPPFMELAGLVLAAAGCCLAWSKPRAHIPASHPAAGTVPNPSREAVARPSYQSGLLISVLLTMVAYGGWYWTEILYDRMVINSFYALHSKLLP